MQVFVALVQGSISFRNLLYFLSADHQPHRGDKGEYAGQEEFLLIFGVDNER